MRHRCCLTRRYGCRSRHFGIFYVLGISLGLWASKDDIFTLRRCCGPWHTPCQYMAIFHSTRQNTKAPHDRAIALAEYCKLLLSIVSYC
jgi:hypothetical protein